MLIKTNFNFACQPVDYSDGENGLIEIRLAGIYLLLKILDLMDTVGQFFFISTNHLKKF
jgi:hypothetical protein